MDYWNTESFWKYLEFNTYQQETEVVSLTVPVFYEIIIEIKT